MLWIYDKAVPVRDAVGRTTLHGHCLDITPEARDRAASRRRTRSTSTRAVANIPAAVYRCACDEAGTIEFLSDQIEELVGYPASDFIDNKVRSYDSIIHPDDLAQVIAEVTTPSSAAPPTRSSTG